MINPVTGMILGSAISGGLGYLGSQSASDDMEQYARAMEEIARLQRQQYEMTERYASPFREALYPQLLKLLTTTDPSALSDLPYYASMRRPFESQYKRARESLGTIQPGGALTRAMGNLEMERARGVGDILGRIYQDLWGQGMGLAGMNLNQGGLSGASQTYGSLYSGAGDIYGSSLGLMGESGDLLGSLLYESYLRDTNTPTSTS